MPLRLADLSWNFAVIKFGSYLNIFPFLIHPVTGQLRIQTSVWRRTIFIMWRFFHVCHSLYVDFRILNAMIDGSTSWDFIPVMVTVTVIISILFAGFHIGFVVCVAEMIKIYNEVLNIQGTKETSNYPFCTFKLNTNFPGFNSQSQYF